METDELSRGLNDDLEWALDMDFFQKLWVGLANQTLTFSHLGSIINLTNKFHLDQILLRWWWMPFQYSGLNNMSLLFYSR